MNSKTSPIIIFINTDRNVFFTEIQIRAFQFSNASVISNKTIVIPITAINPTLEYIIPNHVK